MPLDKDKFKSVTKLVIDKLEGGYFHPNMRTANPKKFGAYHRSGETMFGLDRHAGHGLYYSTPRKSKDVLRNLKNIESGVYTYKTPEAKEFWTTIDKANAKDNWKWLYRGGSLENKLKDLTAQIMLPSYERNAKNYLNAKTKEIVEKDSRLLFHFIYASWNGPGWFQKFANDMNKAVKSGITDADKLSQVALNSRTKEGYETGSPPNKLIAQGGRKIAEIFKTFKDFVSDAPAVKKTISGALIFALMVGAYFFFKRK